MGVKLRSAFQWDCPECDSCNWELGTMADLDTESEVVVELFETLDLVEDGESTPYVVPRVVIGPSFVNCGNCGLWFSSEILEEDREEL